MTIVAWFYGLRVGIVVGLLSFVLNTLLLNMVGQMGLDVVFETGGGPNFISLMLIAAGIGKLSEIHTENKRLHAKLEDEYNLLSTILDNIPVDIFAKDTKSQFIYANHATKLVMNINDTEGYTGKSDFDFMLHKPDEAQQHFDIEQEVIRTGIPNLDQEFKGSDIDGNLAWGMSSKIPYYDINGNIIGIIGVSRGITQWKQVEEALQKSEASLRMALEAAAMRTWRWDFLHNQIVAKGADLPGFSRADYQITYQEFLEGVHSEDREMLQQAFNNVMEKGIAYNVEYRLISPEGIVHWIASKGDIERDKEGNSIAVNGISYDITEHKQAEKHQLELALERERMQLLANFITQVSHEFRTPLSIINTSVYILGKIDNPDKRQRYFQQINQQVKNITLLIENLSTLSKLDSGQIITLETVNLNQILQDIYRSKQLTLQNEEHESKLESYENPLFVYGNVEYLEQAIKHIWGNAIRYTPRDGIITIRSYNVDDNAVIEISDTGIGIDTDDFPHIFERFYRADKVGSTRGFGLGLPIAKAIIERFRGRIEVESVLDEGSTFRIFLPII